jgi:hypothetical protein
VQYEENSTAHMLSKLNELPNADVSKVQSHEASARGLDVASLPRPNYCFIDGEHTDEAAYEDARFCAEALRGDGVIAFHDYDIVHSGIQAFLADHWVDVTFALAFTGKVFALELGSAGMLRHPLIDRAVGSAWHMAVWRLGSRGRSARPLLAMWSVLPRIDAAAWSARRAARRRHEPGSELEAARAPES